MIRRLGLSLVGMVAVILVANSISQAQSMAPLTRHVRYVTQNGQAPLIGYPSPSNTLRLVLVLPLRKQAELNKFLRELYDPASPAYRHFLTLEEFTARFGPTTEDYYKVAQFAESHGLTVIGTSPNHVNLDVTGSIEDIESAFHLKLGFYKHPTENRTFYAPDREPTLDLDVQLWHISGLDNYSMPRPLLHRRVPSAEPSATTGSGPSASFLGSDMRAAYYGGTLTGTGQSVGLVEFFGTDLADLNTYYKNAGQTNNVPITLKSVDGTSTSCTCSLAFGGSCLIGCDDTEQTIDMTQALGMAPGLSSLVMYIGSSSPVNDAGVFNAMATANPLNAQLSCSWAWNPADPAKDDPYFQEFAAQGQNLFQASGDSGAWPNSKGGYFPPEDANVTTVGGTDLTTSSAGGAWASETAWADSGGGISPDSIPIPSWQQTTASSCSNCSQTLRNAPDVSANANFTFYVCADQTSCSANEYGGTSFAAPMWAGYLALVNQQSVANSGKPLGFINPSLYTIGLSSSYDTDFHDITGGSNGYSATTGYDLATGWGSPNGSDLLNALAGPATPDFSLSASPSSVSVAQGNNGSSTVTVKDLNGFTGSVTLSTSTLPAGVTATFGTNPTTSTSSITFSANSTATTGTSTVTVTGTSGLLTHTTTISLTVSPTVVGDFSISATPASNTVTAGGNTSYTVMVTGSGGFAGTVGFGVSGLPTGAGASFNPTSLTGSGSSSLSVTTTTSTPAGTYTLTISGSSPGLTHSTTVSLVVNAAPQPNFTISASPSTLTVTRGTSGHYTVTITGVNGFAGAVSLSVSGLGSRVTSGFSPASVTGSGTSTLTITAASSATRGTRTITIKGTSGSLSHSTTATLTIQ
jgi:subtilase family serine protease